jgi:hypothetical protein
MAYERRDFQDFGPVKTFRTGQLLIAAMYAPAPSGKAMIVMIAKASSNCFWGLSTFRELEPACARNSIVRRNS